MPLPCHRCLNTEEGSWLQKKRQYSLSNTYLSTSLFTGVGDPPVFHAAHKFWMKSVRNLVLSLMVP